MNAARLRERLIYDPVTGVFTWRIKPAGNVSAGAQAGHVNADWYREIRVDGRLYLAHRLAWLYVHGQWPIEELDHRNGIRDDNRIANLREATHKQNGENAARRHDNSSGFIGVSWTDKGRKHWVARIAHNKRRREIGRFSTPEEAYAAYLAAKAELHTFNPVPRT